MPNLAHVWVMIELHVIPNGLLKRCFYLSFYISPLFLIPFQVFLWLNIFKEWPLAILIFLMDVVNFLALPVYRLSRSVAISCFSMLGISTNPPEMESEPGNLEIVEGCGRNQTPGNTKPAPVFHSFSFSCAASIPFQLIMFPVPILPEDDDDYDDSDDDDSDFEEASMYLELDPDTGIEFIEFSPELYFTTFPDSPIRYPSIDDESSNTSSKGRLYPSLDSIWNDAPSSIPSSDSPTESSDIGPERLYPSVGSIWIDGPSSGSSSPVQSIDKEVYPNQGSIRHEHPSLVQSSSPPQPTDKGICDDITTEVLSPGPSSLWNPARQFTYTSHEEGEVVTEFDRVSTEEEDVSVDFHGLSPLPYGLPQVDWWTELPPNAAAAAVSNSTRLQSESSSSNSSLFFPEVALSFEGATLVYESLGVDVNVSSRVEPEEVEKSDSISTAIREAQTVISRSNTDKVAEPRTEWDPFFAKYEEQMRWFDVLNDERTYGISAIKEQLLEAHHPLNEINPANLLWSKNVKKRLLKSLESDLELVYVAQMSLTWEALHNQFRKVETVSNTRNQFFNHNVVGEYQTFKVVLEKFDEDKRFEGRRYWKYVQTRHSFKKLLQVPELSGYVEKGRGRRVVDPNEVLKAIEKCIQALYHFIKVVDKDRFWWKLKRSVWIGNDPPVEDPRDLVLLAQLTKTRHEKELKLKDLQMKNKQLCKKISPPPPTAPLEESYRREMLFTSIDLKLVERVLQMTTISSAQLKWCQQKLGNITFREGKVVRVGSSCMLFPTS